MSQSKETLIKKYESTADTYQEKGNREWAYAKNDLGDEHYGKAKFEFTQRIRQILNENSYYKATKNFWSLLYDRYVPFTFKKITAGETPAVIFLCVLRFSVNRVF